MDFPKDFGPRNQFGRTQARGLAGDDVWLTKRRPGFVAQNKGGYLEVTTEEQTAGLGVVMDGAIAPLPANFLIGTAKTERGSFFNYDTGTTVPDTTRVVGFNPQAIGRGYAYVYEMARTEDKWVSDEYPDIVGSTRWKFDIRLWLTRTGKILDSTFTQPALLTEFTFQPTPAYSLGAYYTGAFNNAVIQTEWVGVSMDEDAKYTYAVHVAMFDNGATRMVRLEPETYRTPIRPIICAPTPNIRIAMRRWMYRQQLHDGTVDVDTLPPVTFCWSKDAGLTWDDLDIDPFEDDFNALIAAADASGASNFAPMLQSLDMQCVAITPYKALMRITVPYWVALNPVEARAQERVKLFTVDLNSGDTDSATTVWDSATDSGADVGSFPYGVGTGYGTAYMTGGMLTIDGGVLLSYIPAPLTNGGDPNYEAHRYTQFTPDGSGYEPEHVMPQATNRTGFITGASKKTLLCPMYVDAATALILYQTQNRGATWEANQAMVAGSLGGTDFMSIQNYTTVHKIRNPDETPAHLAPAAPWSRDVRDVRATLPI